ncbi:putative LOC102095904, partial [Columba livia]
LGAPRAKDVHFGHVSPWRRAASADPELLLQHSWGLDYGQAGKEFYLVALDKQQPQRLDGLFWSQSPGAFAALSLTLCCRHGASPSLRPLLCARLEPLGFPQQTESPEEPGGLSDPTSICKGRRFKGAHGEERASGASQPRDSREPGLSTPCREHGFPDDSSVATNYSRDCPVAFLCVSPVPGEDQDTR